MFKSTTQNKKALSLFLILTLLVTLFSNFTYADDTTTTTTATNTETPKTLTVADFKDIKSTHWAVSAINWGLEQGLVSGYPDGTFRPDDDVTEAEFVVMITKYASNTEKNVKNTYTFNDRIEYPHWAQGYYNGLADWELPLKGTKPLSTRKSVTIYDVDPSTGAKSNPVTYWDEYYDYSYGKNDRITRGQVAKIIAAMYGFNLTEKQAVYFMYENGLSVGLEKGKRTMKSYGYNSEITRAQIITFLKSMDSINNKIMTFKGNSSSIKNADYREIVGIKGLKENYDLLVDFADFDNIAKLDYTKEELQEIEQEQAEQAILDAEQAQAQKLIDDATKKQYPTEIVGVKVSNGILLTSTKDYKFAYKDGKVYVSEFTRFGEVSEQTGGLLKWEYGPKDPLGKDKYYNVFDVDSNIKSGAIALPNSIVIYNGVELPLGDMFEIEDSMKSYNEGTGIIRTSLDYSSLGDKDNGGAFQDPVAFKVLIQNFKQFGATDEMIQAIWDNTDKWYGKSSKEIIGDYIDTSYYYHSKINNVTLHVHVGDGGVSVTLHKGYDYARQFKTTDYEINEHINIK